jgi:hypothetical protein
MVYVIERVFDIHFNATTSSDENVMNSYKNGSVEDSVNFPNWNQRLLTSEYNITNKTKVPNVTGSIAPTPTIVGMVPNVPTSTVLLGSGDTQNNSGGQVGHFLPFLLWYLLLVLCCIIPTCCAYRRRRVLEQRIASQHNERMNRILTLQQQHQDNPNQVPDDAWNLLPYLYYQHQIRAQLQQQAEATALAASGGSGDGQPQQNSFFASLTTPPGGVNEETLRSERARIFRKELQTSSMVSVYGPLF